MGSRKRKKYDMDKNNIKDKKILLSIVLFTCTVVQLIQLLYEKS